MLIFMPLCFDEKFLYYHMIILKKTLVKLLVHWKLGLMEMIEMLVQKEFRLIVMLFCTKRARV